MTRDDIIDVYLAFFAARGFGPATLAAVASHGGTTPKALVDALGDRWAALDAFTRRLDRAGLAAAEPEGSVRDRLFDLIMARFDAATPYRDALATLSAEAQRRPALALALGATLPRTAAMYLSAAGANTIGLSGLARVHGFSALLADVGRTWLGDIDPDQGTTMRALDQRLDRAERIMERLCPTSSLVEEPNVPR